MGKNNKGKGKTCAKKVNGGKCATEKQEINESTDSLRNTLIFKLPASRIFKCSRSPADAETVKGFWPNQEP